MTVRELINALLDCDMDMEVTLCTDSLNPNSNFTGFPIDKAQSETVNKIPRIYFTDWRNFDESYKIEWVGNSEEEMKCGED